jgi:hypothetical protein
MVTASGRRSAVLATAALASWFAGSVALADTPTPHGRAVIRGTGSDVTIVYETSKAAATEVRASLAEDPVAEALRLKTGGEDDAGIIAFLRMNQASLPEVIDSDIVKDFRRAGAGEDVISVLASFTAVDIGETAEGGPIQQLPANTDVPYPGAYPDLVGMGYPFFGGYGGGYFVGGDFGRFGKGHFGRHSGKHGFRRHSGSRSFGKPFSPKRHPSRVHSPTMRGGRPAPRPRGSR